MTDMSMHFSQTERDLAAGGVLTIDLKALRHNYSTIAKRIAPTRTAAVVKADSYGLGANRVAPAFMKQVAAISSSPILAKQLRSVLFSIQMRRFTY